MKRLHLTLAFALLTFPAAAQEKATPLTPATPAKSAADGKTPEKPKSALDLAKDVTPDEAEKLIASIPGLTILDVRSPEEYAHEHIKGSTNININDPDFDQKVAALDQSKPVLVHCAAGGRSGRFLKEAKDVKFPQIYHLREGMTGWVEAKKPVEGEVLPGAGRVAPGKK